ncbi:hypothetical protein GCM10011318_11130 [Phaeocystidibacter marisrubri]|nr:hypothetical protein GCM10011318_11130 [Phaeocystidibacter marisrubri]
MGMSEGEYLGRGCVYLHERAAILIEQHINSYNTLERSAQICGLIKVNWAMTISAAIHLLGLLIAFPLLK